MVIPGVTAHQVLQVSLVVRHIEFDARHRARYEHAAGPIGPIEQRDLVASLPRPCRHR